VPLSVQVGGLLSTNSDELQMASSALRQTIQDSRARINEMESRLESSRTELEAVRGSSAVLEEQLEGLRTIAAQRAQALEAAEASFRAKEEEISRGLREKSGDLDLMNTVVEDLRATVREEQALREEAERALAEEAALREEAEKKMAEMDRIIEGMERKAAEKTRLLEAQGERFEKLSNELKALVAEAESELARESSDRQKAQDDLAEMKAAKEEILLQTEALRSESTKAETEALALQGGLAASQKAAVEKAREQEQELKRLRRELETALKASDGKAREFSTLESRLSKAQAESAEREKNLQGMGAQVQQASGESAAKEEQLKGLKEKVGRLETNIAAVQAAAVEEEQKMVRELERLGKVVETELKVSSAGNRSGELSALQEQMAEQEKRAEQLELEVQEAEAQAATKEAEIQALQASVTALETSLEEVQVSTSGQGALEAELKAAQGQLQSQQAELDAAAERCAALDSSVESAIVQEREQQLQEMEASLRDQVALVEEVQAEAAAKEEQARALEESLKSGQEAATREARDMARKIDALQGELQDVQELRALEARMSDMQDELELAESGLEDVEAELQKPEAAVDEEAVDAVTAAARAARELQSSAPTVEAPGLAAPLALSLGAYDVPHPEKGAGEDALILMPEIDAFAVADGVSGWAEDGVDPAIYPKEIMNGVRAGFESAEISSSGLPGILDYAYTSNEEVGSCTVCVAQLEEEGRRLKVANLGDSGLKVLRRSPGGGWLVAWESGAQQHEFNMPYQMSSDKEYSDTARDADYSTVPVSPGDVIVQATDGLWDNLRDGEMCEIVGARVPPTGGAEVAALAEDLCAAASRNSVDEGYPSPFMQEAVRAGQIQMSIFDKMQGIEPTGGKLDDITVVVAEVTGSPA
jgi:protein phosphatase PTC7